MASQARSSSSNPLAIWLRPVSPTQQLSADKARLAKAKAARKGQPMRQKNPVGRPSGDSSAAVACVCPSHRVTVTACGLLGIAS
eukprot:1159566-Pelagomonas_calceolata.AAC.19